MSVSDIPERDKNQSVFRLLEIMKSQIRQIQELKDEIARLKNRPGRPKLRPSKIGQSKRKLSFPRKKERKNVTLPQYSGQPFLPFLDISNIVLFLKFYRILVPKEMLASPSGRGWPLSIQ